MTVFVPRPAHSSSTLGACRAPSAGASASRATSSSGPSCADVASRAQSDATAWAEASDTSARPSSSNRASEGETKPRRSFSSRQPCKGTPSSVATFEAPPAADAASTTRPGCATSVFSNRKTGAGSFEARSNASMAGRPHSLSSRPVSHGGNPSSKESAARSRAGSPNGKARASFATLRSTALARPAAFGATERTSSTPWSTAAWGLLPK